MLDGNLCDNLCIDRTIRYKSCLYYSHGKKVILAEWNQKDIIVKSKYEKINEYFPIIYKIEKDDLIFTQAPDMNLVLRMVQDKVSDSLGLKENIDQTDLLKKMWTKDVEDVVTMTTADKTSLWMLLQQDEYLFMKYFQNKHMPQIYGSCGYFYAMEYLPTGNILDPRMLSIEDNLDSAPWMRRHAIAQGMLELIWDLDRSFHQVMHLCDVKAENLGVRSDGTIAAIDVDIAFLESQMQGILNQPNCTTHSDCDFFDCLGICDFRIKKCSSQRRDNNLQAFCRKIFLPRHGFPGLLRYPPLHVATELEELLEAECTKYTSTGEKASETRFYTKLKLLLDKSLLKM
uniref:Protein FAM69C-like n=1 Tax=Saccoglossus kowalevskii TaxID=10224 RepID=A0ABM0H048_SACKO|nr:PREDICTED: protein FAM69C-like [Saccoglossus kowalevskii]